MGLLKQFVKYLLLFLKAYSWIGISIQYEGNSFANRVSGAGAYILICGCVGSHWTWHGLLKFSKSTLSDTPPNSSQTVPLTGDQVFKYMSLWGPFSFRPPQHSRHGRRQKWVQTLLGDALVCAAHSRLLVMNCLQIAAAETLEC